jgi:hypothetical protein
LVADNDLNGNTVGPYQLAGQLTGQTRFTGNKGVEQTDGWLSARVAGAVTDGLYDFGNLLYLEGQRIRVVKVTRKLAAGTCDARLEANGASAGGNAVGVTTARCRPPRWSRRSPSTAPPRPSGSRSGCSTAPPPTGWRCSSRTS